MNKYNTKKISVNGMTFDSKKEYRRYLYLSELLKDGKIRDLERQKKYVLVPSQKGENGKVIERECNYMADFVYFDIGANKWVVEDVKGYRNPSSSGYAMYVIKRKLMLYVHGIRIKEV